MNLIMGCVISVSFKVLINEQLTRSFTKTRGIQQGDHLRPYLFVMCFEGFLALIRRGL